MFTDLDATRRTETRQYFDGLGRTYRALTYENQNPTNPWATTDTQYDALGRVVKASLPYRSAGGATPLDATQWSSAKRVEAEYDALGRVKKTTTMPDAAFATTSYSGNTVTVTDQTSKSRRSVSDALGRLKEVYEDPNGLNYLTSYTYDALGNLRRVVQGSQSRYFMYDSLGRLIRAINPEQAAGAIASNITDPVTGNSQWSMAYGYDANGNLTARVDARDITATYTYDRLNRNIITTYAGGGTSTPEVRRHYDGAINGLGRLYWSEAIGISATVFDTYDSAGRPTQYHQSFWTGSVWGPGFGVQRSYNKAGGVTSQTYPSGRTVTYNYDAAGRVGDYNGQASFAGNLGDGAQRTYASEIRYSQLGGREQERFGTQTPVYNKRFFNDRGQMSNVRLSTYSITTPGQDGNWNRGAIVNHYSDQSWAGSGTDNNGNLRKQELYLPNDDAISSYTQMAQHYTYDELNRLQSVTEFLNNQTQSFKQSYAYDRFGNRTIDQATTTTNVNRKLFAVDAATNRLGVPTGQAGAMDYDPAGNLTNDTYTEGTGGTRVFDAENRMTSAQFFNGQTQTALYTYDADGRRVRRQTGAGAQVWQVYGMGGELVAEYAASAPPSSPQKEYGYRAGELLVTASPSAAFSETVWVEDSLPTGATPAPAGGTTEAWNWVGTAPAPHSGSLSSQSNVTAGLHQQVFTGATATLAVGAGEWLTAYVYLDPASPPSEIMMQWNDGTWEHRAYWGANQIGWGTDGTNSRRYMGPLPAAGQWIRLEVPASQTGLEGSIVTGLAFTLYGGRATWDRAGKATQPAPRQSDTIWVEDALPSGATAAPAGGTTEAWDWVGAAPSPSSGTLSTRSGVTAGLHQQVFTGATATLAVGAGDKLIADVYLDPANVPSEVMLQWNDGSWEHRAYWGANHITGWGVDGTNSRRYMGPLPVTGQWVRLEVPASQVGLEGRTLGGMALTLHGGRATWDRAGKAGAAAGGGASNIEWLVTDQLGTPRMVVDETGTLAGVKRHDYFPFGEELAAGGGGRTTNQGYSQPSGIRQGFTGYEKDNETGLNFAQTRYHSPTQGRFTSPDKLFADQYEGDPQSWNLYVYAGNNPLLFTDPTGLWKWVDPEDNGQRFLQWEEGDDWNTLARFLNQNSSHTYVASDLEQAFGGGVGLGQDLIVDATGAMPRFTNTRGVENVSLDVFMNITPGGRGAKVGGGLLSRLWNWVRGRGGKGAATGVARKSVSALRAEYETAVRNLSSVAAEMRAAGHSADAIAIKLHAERRALGLKYKDVTPPDLLQKIYQRNLEKYDDPLGPTIEWLRAQGKTWDEIIESAARPGGKDIDFR
ncbi:MAG: RHS repeat-associated core domain-containing protein [Acidobacteria bacterium]|nr:RHS repeat-associated core domain-containing protein [Acidobacteriota bacterium]